jgi:hypothetical protein
LGADAIEPILEEDVPEKYKGEWEKVGSVFDRNPANQLSGTIQG